MPLERLPEILPEIKAVVIEVPTLVEIEITAMAVIEMAEVVEM